MKRRTFFLTLWAARLLADAKQQVFDLFAKIAQALSADDPLAFLDAVDHDMPHFQDFQDNLMALAGDNDITSSIEVLSDEGDDHHRSETLDWFMELVEKGPSRAVERRRVVVRCGLERRGKKWKIVSIEPLSFFAPVKRAPAGVPAPR